MNCIKKTYLITLWLVSTALQTMSSSVSSPVNGYSIFHCVQAYSRYLTKKHNTLITWRIQYNNPNIMTNVSELLSQKWELFMSKWANINVLVLLLITLIEYFYINKQWKIGAKPQTRRGKLSQPTEKLSTHHRNVHFESGNL